MWIVSALLVHLLLLGSIFVIYFRSPVIKGLQPQQLLGTAGLTAPANRLVLIVTDGLRAESFFKHGCDDVPSLRSIFLAQGLVGLSHTRVPTESRPGHIALIAGLYEDPSAVTRGWKENPIDFDTVFNRSCHTYAWGANDVLHIFSRLGDGQRGCRLLIDAYDHELDFSGKDKTYSLDNWVFEHVKLLLKRKGEDLRDEQQVVFFLHLLGLDTAGHVHKPGSKLFLENLHRTEQGIAEMYELFEEIFPDHRTAYVMTSDHGMTNAGSHGAGEAYETETPFFFWGAGIAKVAPHGGKTFKVGTNATLPLYELEQAQITPLMSALIGLPPPMNNFGILPIGYLDVDSKYEAHAMHSNALQFLEQFHTLLREHQTGLLTPYLRNFERLDESKIEAYIRATENRFRSHDYAAAINASLNIMHAALEGIDYYHGYYRNALLISTTATFLGWIYYLLLLLVEGQGVRCATWRFSAPLCGVGLATVVFVVLQGVPPAVAFYMVLPTGVWFLATQKQCTLSWQRHGSILLQLALVSFCAELLVFTFFERKLISVAYFLFAVLNNLHAFATPSLKAMIWLVLVMVLFVFPLLPPSVGYSNVWLLFLGMLFTMLRPFIVKSRLSLQQKLISYACLANAMISMYQHSNQLGVSIASYAISWCFLIYSFGAIILSAMLGLKQRVELIFFHLTSIYLLLCTSYESLFIVTLASELMIALSAQQLTNPMQLDPRTSAAFDFQSSLRLAFAILLYTFFSCFGTGNIASVSSFDPNIIRCFLSKFSPFVIMSLVIVKLLIPVLLNISIIFGTSYFARTHERQIFICLLLICDVMGLNFLFLVRNRGSWLEIGTSISHFVIMEATTLVLLLVTYLAKLFLRLNTPSAFGLKSKYRK